jgi:PUA-domain protein
MSGYALRNKEVKRLIKEFIKSYKVTDLITLQKSKYRIDCIEIENKKVYTFNRVPLIIGINDELYPSLIFKEVLSFLPNVVVDIGAIAHVCNGADIMLPGIRKMNGEIKKGSLVLIRDEKYGKDLALGISLFSNEDLKNMKKGKVIENVHHVGDKIWRLIAEGKN